MEKYHTTKKAWDTKKVVHKGHYYVKEDRLLVLCSACDFIQRIVETHSVCSAMTRVRPIFNLVLDV